MEKDFDNLQGSRLSVVAFDYRAWGGDEGAIQSAKQYLSARKDVFYFVFLALSPLKRKGDRKTPLEARRTSRWQRLALHFADECGMILLDEDLIALTQVFLPCGSALLEDSPNWPEKIRRKMSEPVRDILTSLEHIRGTLDPGRNTRCFGHALQSETRAIIFIGIVGSRLQDSLLLRKALAEGYSECEKLLITVGVSSSGPTHVTYGKVNWTDLDAVQAAQNGAFVELALNLGVAYSLSRSLGRTFQIKNLLLFWARAFNSKRRNCHAMSKRLQRSIVLQKKALRNNLIFRALNGLGLWPDYWKQRSQGLSIRPV